jgi:hypothetical protein
MEHSPVKIGWRRILGMFVLVTTMPYFAHAQQYESIVVPRGDLPDRLDNTLGELGAARQPVDAHDEWSMGDGPAPVKSAGDLIDNGCWYGETDFTVMHRSRAGRINLGLDRDNNVVQLIRGGLFTTRDRDMGIQPGARITFGRYFPRDDENRDRSFEFTFLGLNSWDVDQSLRSASSGSITTLLGDQTGGFLDSDEYTSHYHSSFNSFEFNYRIGNRLGRDRMVLQPDGCWHRECEPGPLHAAIFGLRLIEINENFRWLSRRDDFPTDEYRGDFLIRTENPLLGLQFGLDCYEQYCNWSYGIRGKGGIYANFSSQDTHVIENRRLYQNKFAAMLPILEPVMDIYAPEAGFYLWPTVDDDERFTRELYEQQHVMTLPGSYLSRSTAHGDPGKGHVRLSLTASVDECREAAQRIRTYIESR